jgi:hypothetical protein
MGRPTKLTPETQEKICHAIRLGAIYEHACNYAGVTYSSFRNWMIKGEAAKSGKFLDFFEAIKKAEGTASSKWLGMIEEAAEDGNWQAAAWKLERRYPDAYGKRMRVDQRSVNLDVDLNGLEDEQILRLASGENPSDVLGD